MDRLLFGAGSARGGTGILVQTLGAHSRLEYALDPFLGVLKFFRNAVVRSIPGLQKRVQLDWLARFGEVRRLRGLDSTRTGRSMSPPCPELCFKPGWIGGRMLSYLRMGPL